MSLMTASGTYAASRRLIERSLKISNGFERVGYDAPTSPSACTTSSTVTASTA
jgi:hypothetical protein